MRKRVVGIDAHVLTHKFQGTRSTLTSLLRAIAPRLAGRSVLVYAEDAAAAAAIVGSDALDYRDLPAAGSVRRLLSVFPALFRRDRVTLGVFQYIAPLRGRNIVFVHDILPITHPRYFGFKSRLKTWLFYSLSIRRATRVLVVSEDTRRHVERIYRLPPGRIVTLLNGPSFPAQAYAGAYRPGAERYILTVGRIEARKNVPLLVDAFLAADVPDVRLVIVGAFDYGFAYTMPDDPRIDVLSGVAEEALIALYRGASLFAYPSAAEGFGMPLLDATLFGIPTISSDRTAMPEVGGALAVYFDPERPDAASVLADLIRGHFGDRPVPAPTAAQRAAQAERFSWERAAETFLAVTDACAQEAETAQR